MSVNQRIAAHAFLPSSLGGLSAEQQAAFVQLLWTPDASS
jgi:hypothetical protein